MKRTTTCSPIVGQFFAAIIVAASDKEWLQQPIKILVLETVLSHLKLIVVNQNYSFNSLQTKTYIVKKRKIASTTLRS